MIIKPRVPETGFRPGRYSIYYLEFGCYLSVGAELNWPYRVLDIHLPFCHIRLGRPWDEDEKEISPKRLLLVDVDTTDRDVGPGVWAIAELSLHDWWMGVDVSYDRQGELDINLGIPGLTILIGGRTGVMRRIKEYHLAHR